MVLNDTLVVFADANPVDVLRAYPVLDKPATRLLAERLFPGATIEEIGDVLLADALNPPEDVAYIGSFTNLDLVCSWRLMPDRPSQLGKEVLAASERRQVFLHAMHSEAEWCLYGLWQDGTRIRALSVCPDPGVIEDEGEKLGFELAYWAGDRVALTTTKGTKTFLVSGSGMVPNGAHNNYADGGWLTNAGYDVLFDAHKFHLVYVSLRRGGQTPAQLSASISGANPDLAGVQFGPPDPLTELVELKQVRLIPILLGAFLALLAIGAVGHALATAVRRRAHDLAVLRALGMTQWQCRWIVATQATLLAGIGLTFGAPLGLALGRIVWRTVTDYTPLQYVAPFAVWAMLLVGPAALLLANALAALPGRRAARLRIAQILRTE